MFIFFEYSPPEELDFMLDRTFAGSVLAAMRKHHQARCEAKRLHSLSMDPEFVARNRAEKRAARAKAHQERVEKHRVRSISWLGAKKSES